MLRDPTRLYATEYHLPIACHTFPKDTTLAFGRDAPSETVQAQPSYHRLSTNRLSPADSLLVSPLKSNSGLTPTGKTLPTYTQKQVSEGEGTRGICNSIMLGYIGFGIGFNYFGESESVVEFFFYTQVNLLSNRKGQV